MREQQSEVRLEINYSSNSTLTDLEELNLRLEAGEILKDILSEPTITNKSGYNPVYLTQEAINDINASLYRKHKREYRERRLDWANGKAVILDF